MLNLVTFICLALAGLHAQQDEQASPATDPAVHHQFDFWIGEWSVQNRHIGADGEWHDGDRTRARITPVCGGRALLEEWAGPFRGGFMNGFSLRAWDPQAKHWNLLLNWTMDGNGSFGRLTGGFRHGRGEFFFPSGDALGRYTFSDALADSVRWDSATSKDGGETWRTDWIMEFTRTRPAAQVTVERLFAEDWTEGTITAHAEARAMDFALGDWEGTWTAPSSGLEQTARLRAKTLNKGCLVIDSLGLRSGDRWIDRFAVRGWVPRAKRWESSHLTHDDTRLIASTGRAQGGGMVFEGAVGAEPRRRETWTQPGPDTLRIETVQLAVDDEPNAPAITIDLRRVHR